MAIELRSSKAIAGKELSYNRGVASSGLTVGILTGNFSAGTRSSCVQ